MRNYINDRERSIREREDSCGSDWVDCIDKLNLDPEHRCLERIHDWGGWQKAPEEELRTAKDCFVELVEGPLRRER